MKYNYVIFGSDDPYYVLGYEELENRDDAIYLSEPYAYKNRAMRLLRKAHMTARIRKYIDLPGKRIWNKRIFTDTFDNCKPICFIFFSAGPFAEHIPYGFIEYLKNKYPDSKYAVFYQDLVGSNKRTVSLESYREKMDIIISFDYEDCKNYKMLYHPLVYSDIVDSVKGLDEKSDIYFCGAEKNRLQEIIEAYNFFIGLGFVCDFNVITSNEDLLKKNNNDGIHYYSTFSYIENLRHIKSCKAMLEIMQKGGTGFTIRALECIAFNKKLITNNDFIRRAHFYNENNIMPYKKSNNCDREVYNDFISSASTAYEYMESILPHEFLEFIDEKLQVTGDYA